MKKLLLGALSLIMALGCTVACGGNNGGTSDGGSASEKPSGVTNPYALKVFNFNGGYGSE